MGNRYTKKGIADADWEHPDRYRIVGVSSEQQVIIYSDKGQKGNVDAQPLNETNMTDIEDGLVSLDDDLAVVEADYVIHAEHDLKQNITDNGLNTTNKTIVGSINEVKADSEYKDLLQDDAIALVNNKINALPTNGSLKNIKSTTVGLPTAFTVMNMFDTKQEVANYQPASLDYKGSGQPGNIVMKSIGDYIFDFSIEATHTNATDTTITLEAYIDGIKYDTATRVLGGGNNQINGFTGFFSFSKVDDATPSEIYFQYKASQGNTTSAKAMLNTNLQGSSGTMLFTDTNHVIGSDLNETTYNDATSTFIINDLDARSNILETSMPTKLNKTGDTMTGVLNMGNFDIVGANSISISDAGSKEGYILRGGNGWVMSECPDDLSNAAGDLQLMNTGTGDFSGTPTRRATVRTDGTVWASNGFDANARTIRNVANGTAIGDAVNKEQLDTKITLHPRIAAGTDVNTLTTPGMYFSPANADACINVPIASTAFSLLVEKHAGVKQTWTSYVTGSSIHKTFTRNYYQTWGEWQEVITNKSATASPTYNGLMHKDDKAKLDGLSGAGKLSEFDEQLIGYDDAAHATTLLKDNLLDIFQLSQDYIGDDKTFTFRCLVNGNSANYNNNLGRKIFDLVESKYGLTIPDAELMTFEFKCTTANGTTNPGYNNCNWCSIKSRNYYFEFEFNYGAFDNVKVMDIDYFVWNPNKRIVVGDSLSIDETSWSFTQNVLFYDELVLTSGSTDYADLELRFAIKGHTTMGSIMASCSRVTGTGAAPTIQFHQASGLLDADGTIMTKQTNVSTMGSYVNLSDNIVPQTLTSGVTYTAYGIGKRATPHLLEGPVLLDLEIETPNIAPEIGTLEDERIGE